MIRTIGSFALALFLLASAGFADIAPDPLGSGMTPRPRDGEVTVAMASEVVDLALSKDRLDVKATFEMENSGAETAFEVGFPTSYADDLKDFAVEAGGKKIAFTHAEKQVDGGLHEVTEYWLVWPMKFAAGEKITVVVTYWVRPNDLGVWIGNESSSDWDVRFGGEKELERMGRRASGYILRSGAPWKGPIGSAVVKLTLGDGLTSAHLREVSPAPASSEAGRVEWKFESFEPTKDIRLTFNPVLTVDEEIKAVEGALTRPDPEWNPLTDDFQFMLHLADLHELKGDIRGMLDRYETLADLAIGSQEKELTLENDVPGVLLECVDHLLDGHAALHDPDGAVRSTRKAAAFLEKWVACMRKLSGWEISMYFPSARLALARCRLAAGLDASELLRDFDLTWPWGYTLDLAVESDGGATLQEEGVIIDVGAIGVTFETTLRILGKRDGTIILIYDELQDVEARLVGLSDGFFDGFEMTVNGAPLAASCIERKDPPDFDGNVDLDWFLGWKVPVKPAATTEVRFRSKFPFRRTQEAWLWNPDDVLPVDERGMDRVCAWYAVRGRGWKGSRKVTAVARFPEGLSTANLRYVYPAAARVSEREMRWELEAVETSAGEVSLKAMVRGFSRAQEIEYLEKLIKKEPVGHEIVRLQLALAYGEAGRVDDGIRILQALVTAGSKPLRIEGNGSEELDPGMYQERPTEFYLLDALRRAGKEAEAKELAPRAVAALREEMKHGALYPEEQVMEWEDLLVCSRLLGDEAGIAEAQKKLEALRAYLAR